MELQNYLANRDKKLTYEELESLKDDYINYYKGVIDSLLNKFTYNLSQFVFFQEELCEKKIIQHYEIFTELADMIQEEIKVFANTPELYEYFEINKLIDDAFSCGDCSALVKSKYKDEYMNCKKLLTDINYLEWTSIIDSICRTKIAKEWTMKGEVD